MKRVNLEIVCVLTKALIGNIMCLETEWGILEEELLLKMVESKEIEEKSKLDCNRKTREGCEEKRNNRCYQRQVIIG